MVLSNVLEPVSGNSLFDDAAAVILMVLPSKFTFLEPGPLKQADQSNKQAIGGTWPGIASYVYTYYVRSR